MSYLLDEFESEFSRGDLRPADKYYSFACERSEAELESVAWALRLLRDSAEGLEIAQLDDRQRNALERLDASQLWVYHAFRLAFETQDVDVINGYFVAYDHPGRVLFNRAAEQARESVLRRLGLVGSLYGVRVDIG